MPAKFKIEMSRVRAVLGELTGKDGPHSMRGLSMKAGMSRDGVRDIVEGRSKEPSIETLSRLAEAAGKDLSVFASPEGQAERRLAGEFIEVRGSVQAGVWRASSEWDYEDRFTIVVGPSPYPSARRFALRVDGDSMDTVYPAGTLLDCVTAYDINDEYAPEDGDHVIVERIAQDDTREMTVKEWKVDDAGKVWLLAKSTKPEFQGAVPLVHVNGDTKETRIAAIVIGSYTPSPAFRKMRQ